MMMKDLKRGFSETGDEKQFGSGYSYWGIGPTLAWARACTDHCYLVMKESIRAFGSSWSVVQRLLDGQKFHYVSLGIGTGQKDYHVLGYLVKGSPRTCFMPVDMSPTMLRIGIQAATKDIPISRDSVLPIEIDFSVEHNVSELREMIEEILEGEPVLFSLLGNTLANFEDDKATLGILSRLIRPNDRLLLELATTDNLTEEATAEAVREYSDADEFRRFAISALLQNTDLHVDWKNDVQFIGEIEENRGIKIKSIYKNQTGQAERVTLPNGSQVDFPNNDTIRLYLSRKYTEEGVDLLLKTCGFSDLHRESLPLRSHSRRCNFGMDLMLLERSGSMNVEHSSQRRGTPAPEGEFDVFLCHNSTDKSAVRRVNKALRESGLTTWFDEEQLPLGVPWQPRLEQQVASVKAACVFVGEHGLGPWQDMEARALLTEFVRRGCPVVPVILPSAQQIPELPLFLRQMTWVDLRRSYERNLRRMIGALKQK